MKKVVLSVALATCFLGVVGQKLKKENISFEDIRLPLSPLGSDLEGYNFTLSTSYPESYNNVVEDSKKKYEDDLANYPNKVKESEDLYQEALAQYKLDVITARENFQLESDEFKKLTVIERLSISDQKPVLNLPRKPSYYKPSEPYYSQPDVSNAIVFNPKVLAQTYLKLDGFSRKNDGGNVLEGSVTCYDFEYIDTETKVETKSQYNATTKESEDIEVYSYITKYKRPAIVTLKFKGKVVFSGIVEKTNEYTVLTTASPPSMHKLEKVSVGESLTLANDFINDMHGFSKIKTNSTFKYVKNKKGLYDDLEKAHEYAVSGYKEFDASKPNSDLETAIAAWDKALKEADLNNKKARINQKVAEMLTFKLIETCIYSNKIKEANEYIDYSKKLNLNNIKSKKIAKFEEIITDKVIRIQANKKVG